jgi:hypothetical protein
MNNASLFTADRATHVKIVVMSLISAIVVLLIGISAHGFGDDSRMAHATVIKAGKPVVVTTSDANVVR